MKQIKGLYVPFFVFFTIVSIFISIPKKCDKPADFFGKSTH